MILPEDIIFRIFAHLPQKYWCAKIVEKMPDETKQKYAAKQVRLRVADLQKIAAFRNVVVHKYFGAEPEIIFAVANDEVPIFEKQVLNLLKKIEDKAYLLQAIELTIPIYAKMKRDESVAYLKMVLEKLK